MSSTRNNTPLRRNIISLGLCVAAILFLCSISSTKLAQYGMDLFSPRAAQSAIVPADQFMPSFQSILEDAIYLPHEVDLNAGSNFVPDEAQSGASDTRELGALLDGQGRQCNFHDHATGALALNGQHGCM